MNTTNVNRWLADWSAAGGGWAKPNDGDPIILRPDPHPMVPDMRCDVGELDRLAGQLSDPTFRATVIAHLGAGT